MQVSLGGAEMRIEPDDVPLGELVEKVRAYSDWAEAVCRRSWITPTGPCSYEIGRWLEGHVYFTPLTPLWSSREAAWNDAVNRLGQR